MRAIFLFVGGIVAGLAIQSAVAQNPQEPVSGVVGINHVALAVPDMNAAIAYYTQTMGFSEAFRNTDEKGQPTLVYIQISRNTFVELQPVNAQRPAGIYHFGVHVENIDAATRMWKQRGVNLTDPRVSAGTKAILSNITDPNGVRIELAELPPESLHRQAMERWR